MQLSLSLRIYVYYRVGAAAAPACIAAVAAAQQRLTTRHPGLQTALLAKQPDGLTLMETYAWSPADGSTDAAPEWPAMEAELAGCTAPFIEGTRHAEIFAPCA